MNQEEERRLVDVEEVTREFDRDVEEQSGIDVDESHDRGWCCEREESRLLQLAEVYLSVEHDQSCFLIDCESRENMYRSTPWLSVSPPRTFHLDAQPSNLPELSSSDPYSPVY